MAPKPGALVVNIGDVIRVIDSFLNFLIYDLKNDMCTEFDHKIGHRILISSVRTNVMPKATT